MKKVLRSQFKSFKSKCSLSIGNIESYDLEFLSHKKPMKFAFFFITTVFDNLLHDIHSEIM